VDGYQAAGQPCARFAGGGEQPQRRPGGRGRAPALRYRQGI